MVPYYPFADVGLAINVWILLHIGAAVISVVGSSFMDMLSRVAFSLFGQTANVLVESRLTIGVSLTISRNLWWEWNDVLNFAYRVALAIVFPIAFGFLFKLVYHHLDGMVSSCMVGFDVAMPLSIADKLHLEEVAKRDAEMRELDDIIREFQAMDSKAGGEAEKKRSLYMNKKRHRKHRRKGFYGRKRSCHGRRFWSHSPRKQRRRGYRHVQRLFHREVTIAPSVGSRPTLQANIEIVSLFMTI